MPEHLPLHAAPLLVMMGIATSLAVHELWLWRGSRGEPFHGWAALWSLITLVLVLGRFVQRIAIAAPLAAVGFRIELVAAAAIAVTSVAMVRATNARSLREPWLLAYAGITAVLAAICLATPWVVTDSGPWVTDLLGVRSIDPALGAAAFALLPVFATSMVACARELRSAVGLARARRRRLRPLAWISGLAAANDLLFAFGVVRSVRVFEYVFVGVGFAVSLVLMWRIDDARAHLEAEVAARTDALREHERRIDEALADARHAEARMRSLSAAALDGVLVHEHGTIIDANEAITRLAATDAAALIGRPIRSLLSDADEAALAAVIDGTSPTPVEASFIAKGGSTHPVELLGRRHGDADGDVGVVAVREIGERKAMQARLLLADRLASVGTLAAGAAHEINNPLAYVTANVELVHERLTGQPMGAAEQAASAALLDEAAEGCERIGRIVANLRSLARGEAPLQRAVDLASVVDLALRMTANQIRHRARLRCDFPTEPLMVGDDGRLGQVFVNLLINAVTAIPEGATLTHEIEVTLAASADRTRVIATVRDTGGGIAPEVLPRVFDPFFTTRTQGRGMGLGLSICHSIVSDCGGEIAITSERGRGTTVRVTLPMATAQPGVADPPRAVVPSSAPAHILVVDDEPGVGAALARALVGHRTAVATGGRQAVELARTGAYDLVLCDLMMPDLPGMGVHAALHALDPKLADRIVFMTGGAFTGDAREFLARVPNERLEKPIGMHELRAFVARWIGQHPFVRE